MNSRGAFLAVVALAAVQGAYAAEQSWKGQSNDHGGRVLYGYFVDPPESLNPEIAESRPLTITCNGFDGSLIVSIPDDHPTFNVGSKLQFVVDHDVFEYGAGLSYVGGDFTAVPIVELPKGDPLIEALMRGRSTNVFFAGYQVMTVPLAGTRGLFTSHLRPCL
jgi:hypothetical protein